MASTVATYLLSRLDIQVRMNDSCASLASLLLPASQHLELNTGSIWPGQAQDLSACSRAPATWEKCEATSCSMRFHADSISKRLKTQAGFIRSVPANIRGRWETSETPTSLAQDSVLFCAAKKWIQRQCSFSIFNFLATATVLLL